MIENKMKRFLFVPLFLATLLGCSQKSKNVEIPIPNLPTLEEIKDECKAETGSVKDCIDYEIKRKKRLCDSRVFPNRYEVDATRRDIFNDRIFDLEIAVYPTYFYQGKAEIDGTLKDIITGEVYKLKEIFQYPPGGVGEKTVTLDYNGDYKWIPLKQCKSYAEKIK